MSTDISRLKKGAKGPPPEADEAESLLGAEAPAAERSLQVRIPENVFEEFSATAGREFGYRHGAKKRMFLKLWEAYKAAEGNG